MLYAYCAHYHIVSDSSTASALLAYRVSLDVCLVRYVSLLLVPT